MLRLACSGSVLYPKTRLTQLHSPSGNQLELCTHRSMTSTPVSGRAGLLTRCCCAPFLTFAFLGWIPSGGATSFGRQVPYPLPRWRHHRSRGEVVTSIADLFWGNSSIAFYFEILVVCLSISKCGMSLWIYYGV